VIEAFPEEAFFNYSIGGMRPFAALVMGNARNGGPRMHERNCYRKVAQIYPCSHARHQTEVLTLWDEVTGQINSYWAQIPPGRFQEHDVAFGVYEGTIYSHLLYFIDNEVHHRGQGTSTSGPGH
jgi:hypothetical protein